MRNLGLVIVAFGLLIGCDKAKAAIHDSTKPEKDPAAQAVPTTAAADPGVPATATPPPAPTTPAKITTTTKTAGGDKISAVTPADSSVKGAKAPEQATGDTLTTFQRKRLLGHFSTLDGASGFILDRTVTPFRAKLDGTSTVMTLTESHGPRGMKEYRGTDFWIRIDENGTVVLFDGPKQTEGVRIVRDADAAQLK